MAAADDVPTTARADADRARDGDEGLLLDRLLGRLDAFRVLREHHEDEAAALLESIGISGQVEEDMVDQLGDATPLAHPERFWDAHRTMVRALEVLDRNGSRAPSSLPLRGPFAPLKPVAGALVQQFVRTQVKSYERQLIEHLRRLYALREAASRPGSADFTMLRLARKQATRLAPDFRRGGFGLPGLLVGGVVLSSIGSLLSGVLDVANRNPLVWVVIGLVFVGIALGTFWVILTSAAIARRRIRIAIDEPLRALNETVGRAGEPPKDPTKSFVVFAALALVIGWITVPIVMALLLLPD